MSITHTKKMLLAWSCLQWWLSLESSTIPLVRAFIQKSWYFQALCFLLLSWKACLSAGRGWITRLEQNLEVHREPWCRWAAAEVVPCQQQRQVSSVPRPANPDLLVPQRSLAPNAKSAAFLHKPNSRAMQKGCIHLWDCHARNECVHLDACSGFEHIWGALVREGRGGVVVGEVVWWCTFLFRSMREVMNDPVDLLPDVQ